MQIQPIDTKALIRNGTFDYLSLTSIFSLFNLSHKKDNAVIQIKENIAQIEFIEGVSIIENVIYSNSTVGVILKICAIIWIVIMAILVAIFIFSFFIAKFKLQTAFIIKNNDVFTDCKKELKINRNIKLFKSSQIDSAIVMGIINPRIIISDKLDLSDQDTLTHILSHELVHIKRFDYILKIVARLTLMIHWFNPIIWICYLLFEKDMEVSCDDLAVSVIGIEHKNLYAQSIINMVSIQHNFIFGNIIGFGELTVKSRVKNIARYKKISWYKNIIAIICILLIGIVTTTNPVVSAKNYYYPQAITISEVTQKELASKIAVLVKGLEHKDIKSLATLAKIDTSIAELRLGSLIENDYDFLEYKIFPQSESISYSYIYFKNNICLVAVFETIPENDVVLQKLYDVSTFENLQIVKRDYSDNEAASLIEIFHKFGIINPFSDIEKIPKPAITGFCIEDARTDLIQQGKLSPDDIYIQSKYIEQDAKRYFNLMIFHTRLMRNYLIIKSRCMCTPDRACNHKECNNANSVFFIMVPLALFIYFWQYIILLL